MKNGVPEAIYHIKKRKKYASWRSGPDLAASEKNLPRKVAKIGQTSNRDPCPDIFTPIKPQ